MISSPMFSWVSAAVEVDKGTARIALLALGALRTSSTVPTMASTTMTMMRTMTVARLRPRGVWALPSPGKTGRCILRLALGGLDCRGKYRC